MAEQYVTRLADYKPSGRKVGDKRVAIGIDLDGCVDNGMEKHLLAFGTASIKHFGMQMIQGHAMDAWMFVNCYSKSAGITRFKAVYMWTDVLRESPIVQAMGVKVPELKYLRRWANEVTQKFSPEALYQYLADGDLSGVVKNDGDRAAAFKELHDIWEWSNQVNALVPSATENISAFPNAVKVIRRAHDMGADLAIASGTPEQHVKTMVQRYGIDDCLQGLFAQQAGKKHQTLITLMAGPVQEYNGPLFPGIQPQYDALLMIGDAPKDYKELKGANGILTGDENNPGRMFMVKVGGQNESWGVLDKVLDDICSGTWDRAQEDELIQEALKNLDRRFPFDSPINRFPLNE